MKKSMFIITAVLFITFSGNVVAQDTVVDIAVGNEDFSTLVAAIEAAGVEDAVVNVGPLTIFAPVNAAFDKLPEGTVATLLLPENKSKLAFILTNHVAPANYPDTQLAKEANMCLFTIMRNFD